MMRVASDQGNRVGPVLEACDASQAVIAAICELNENVEVKDRGSYLRVLVPERCVVTREAIERALARPFRLPGDLELLMPAFAGVLTMTGDQAVWSFRGAP